ncbi:MAG TPA: hypothetical protein VFA15_09030 [Nitrososphaera sp.]|nr:hypothetical protein [Nitrososphaera sp.]
MPKAKVTTSTGATILIEGSTEEVAALVALIEGHTASPGSLPAGSKKAQGVNTSLSALISTLVEAGFFKQPKDLAAVKARLDEMGHVYPVTTLSPAMLRSVRSRTLRRLKQGGRWFYTG